MNNWIDTFKKALDSLGRRSGYLRLGSLSGTCRLLGGSTAQAHAHGVAHQDAGWTQRGTTRKYFELLHQRPRERKVYKIRVEDDKEILEKIKPLKEAPKKE